ncbi:hypothetical protein [Stutzerimonas kunmingensis]|uniref:hypothetical protein n=1 Tax=Stutzerimonas kunmingensis TaxID=1211807 RepID=UPI0028A74456|nr:hypothetical protein [Stutzerimonas kunmingensis]
MITTSGPIEQHGNSYSGYITAPTLIASVLTHLLVDGSLNKYEAARKLGDWSLHSTISSLANTYGVTIKRVPEKVSHARQPIARYSIKESHRRHARAVLAKLKQRKRSSTLES